MNKFSKFSAEVICELHPLFKGLLWVSAARSSDETRAVLMNLLIERDGTVCHIVATDGRRLHHHAFDAGLFDTDIDMLEAGQWEVITKTAKLIVIAPCEESYNYPNWRQVVPKNYTPEHSASINSQTISRLGITTGVLLASDFVNDAIGFKHGMGKDSSVVIDFGSSGQGQAFVITHELGTAIVMPLKMDGEDKAEPKTEAEMTRPLPGLERKPLDETTEEKP